MVFTVDSERMAGFGYKTGWLAFDGAGPDEIVAALGGRILGPHGWADGVERSYGEPDTVLITPRLPGAGDAGWTLVAGNWIAEHADDLDTAALSAKLGGQVQLFVTHRVVELHRAAWSADPSGLDGQPATGSLMLASLSTARHKRRARIPLRRPVPIDITDLITSGRSFEDVNAEIGRRIRQQATWRQRILGQWRHHRSVRRVEGAE